MKALTLQRPWDQAILHGGKNFENRLWKLWDSMISKTIALHAGKTYDKEGADWMKEEDLYMPPTSDNSPEGIVGLVRFDGVVEGDYMTFALQEDQEIWFCGPFGWHIEKSKAFDTPFECKGKQGLWTVPADIENKIRQIVTGGKAVE